MVFGTMKKERERDLRDRARTPKRQPRKTPIEIEEGVIEAKTKTRLGPLRLALYLEAWQDLRVPAGTIRHVLRRSRDKITHSLGRHRKHTKERPFADWYSARAFGSSKQTSSSLETAKHSQRSR